MPPNGRSARIARWGFLAGALLTGAVKGVAAPSIELTSIPAFGSFDNLGGQVHEASPALHRVAVFIYVPGTGWWSKPSCAAPLTSLLPDGSWTADVTTGGVDERATKITALLVSSNYNEPCVEGPATLPASVLAQAIASVTAERADPATRWLSFSGYDWWVKESTGPVGPGPNHFSSQTNNVWVDMAGRLHLRITHSSNQWQCAEIVSRRTFGHGNYRFELDAAVDFLDPNVVLGLFTWSDDPAYTHREIDIECGRWANANDVNNAQYVVQPWDFVGHLVRYAIPPDLTNTTHLFTWETNRIRFESQRGSYSPAPAPADLISSWLFTNAPAVPQTGDEKVRLNLWLMNGQPPSDAHEVEVVIKSFAFVPLGPPLPAVLTGILRPPDGTVQFEILGETDRRYRVEVSENLLDWEFAGTVLATHGATPFTMAGQPTAGPQFFRTVTLP